MRKPRIAILGATGVVGREITKITDELGIEFEDIKFLSSARSAGSKITFKGREHTVEEAKPEVFDGINIVMASPAVAPTILTDQLLLTVPSQLQLVKQLTYQNYPVAI